MVAQTTLVPLKTDPALFWGVNIAFMLAGVAQTLLAFEFDEIGFAKDSTNLLNAMGNPLGQLLFTLPDIRLWRCWDNEMARFALPIIVGELSFNLFTQLSIQKIGSGMFAVLYSSVVVVNAALGTFFGKRFNCRCWCSLLFIVFSVAFTSLAQVGKADVDTATQVTGIIFALLGALCVSLSYTWSNRILEVPWLRPAPKPMVLAFMVGVAEVSVIAVYFFLRVVPNWDELVASKTREDATTTKCVMLYVVYLVICGIHQYAFYFACSLGPAGAVTAGVNKALQTAVLFFFSDRLFCSVSSAQCLTIYKDIGAFGVCLGVVAYGCSSDAKPADGCRNRLEDSLNAELAAES
eukprot:TRINITY_DN102587_c0_g1_i1.p1 TRINITY_DN102587_c0_g1~~TRINITY_DN102587_c0_g1_i1.p1  ORF type:complete len:350 (-),score=42.89 TRINITY_DN102587_c0_g1_i1:76-1125(-)